MMELKVLEESAKRMEFELKGEGHTFCNALKNELWKNKHVKTATYMIGHPLVGVPIMLVETDGELSPRKALQAAAGKLLSLAEDFSKEAKKIKA